MNKVKRIIIFLLFLVCAVSPLLAEPSMVATWTWKHEDPDIAYYRYQLDGEDEEKWIVVPGSVHSYSEKGLDAYTEYTLYLQCSYDGVIWSESAVSSALPLFIKETPVIKGVSVVEEVPVAEEVPAVEEVPVEEEVPVSPKSNGYGYKTNILVSTGVATNIISDRFSLYGTFPRLDLGLEFQNIIHAGPWGLGIRTDINTIVEPKEQNWNMFDINDWYSIWFDSSADVKLMMYLGNRGFDFYLGSGVGYTLFSPALNTPDYLVKYGHSLGNIGIFSTGWYVSGNLGLRVSFNELFSLGVETNYRYLLPAKKHTTSVDMVLGFHF